MNKTQKRQLNLRNKLMAAVAMLLVSSIMMVSTTYAWFTLSTAPEVQGISTTVGTNGNLEIALSPLDGVTNSIDSTVGDATKGWTIKNTTWGNLLDLSHAEYELDKIVLLPSQLAFGKNESGADKVDVTTTGLSYPVYGSDGRISALDNAKTTIGVKQLEANQPAGATELDLTEGFQLNKTGYGIRAIGTSSGQTENERVFGNGISALRNGMSQAAGVATSGLNANGQALANMMIEHATAAEGATENFAQYMDELGALLTSLDGSLVEIDSALKGAVTAVLATQVTGEVLKTKVNAVAGATDIAALLTTAGVTNDGISAALNQRKVIADSITAAKNAYDTIKGNTTVSWTDVSTVINHLMNTTGVTINGYGYNDIKSNMGGLVSSVMGNGGQANIQLGAGSGVYYEIHKMANKIYASTKMVINGDLYAAGMGMIPVDAVIETVYEGTTVLNATLSNVSTKKPAEEDPDAATSVTKLDAYYGYILDFVFRTNAAGSNLQLQTEAANRVYSNDGSEATLGGGSTITFRVPDGVNPAIVKGMVEGIRVVFFDTTDGTVYGVAKATTVESEITDAATSWVGNLTLCDYSLSVDGKGYVTAEEAITDSTLCALSQNQAKRLSVMVSLDGSAITNENILAEGNLSGLLNLQFSSSAQLVPMQNTDLKTMESFDVFIGDTKVDNVENGGTFTYKLEKDTIKSVIVTKGESNTVVENAYDATTGVITVGAIDGDVHITIEKKVLTATTVTITTELAENVQVTVNGRKTAAAAANEDQKVTVNANSQTVTVYTDTDVDYTVTVPAGYTVTESPDNTWTVTKDAAAGG